MPKTYLDVQREFEAFRQQNPDAQVDLGTFAQQMDAAQGVQDRAGAYKPAWYKTLNAGVDRVIEATGAPQGGRVIGRFVGEGVDSTLGTSVAQTLEDIGGSTPRMIGEGLATLPAGGAGAWGRGLGMLGKVLGYGSAGVRGYAETDSPAGAVISAGSLALGNKLLLPKEMGGVDVGGRVRTGLQDLLAPKLEGTALQVASTAEKFVPALAGVGADVGTATALNEATRQANLTVMPDEMRAPGDRNPFTQENIAGNLAGAAFFMPQIVSALRNRPRVSIGQARQLHDFLTKNEQALADLRGEQPLPQTDVAPAVTGEVDAGVRDRHEALYGIIRSSLDAAGEFDKIGDFTQASYFREHALRHIDEAAAGRYSPMPPDLIEKIKVSVDNEARMQPPSDPTKFEGFVNEVRGIVDMMNEGKLSYADELAQREEVLNRNDKKAVAAHEAWKQSMQENKGKSWHPEARSSEVVDRLWKSGNLQPLTPEWLSKEFNASFDDSGNPTFSTRVVAQKVANYALDNLDAALKQEQATRKAVTETSQAVRKYNDIDLQFAEALAKLPQDVRDAVIRRSVEIRRYGNYTPDQAERMGVTEGTRTKVTGEVTSPYLPWQKAVIRAMKSYDPETRTALLRMRGKGFQRTTLDTLVRKDGSKYVWEPNEQTVAPALGGKSSTKGVTTEGTVGKRFETNIEGLPTKEGQDAVGALDEEEFKAALAQTSQEPNLAGDFGSIHFEGEAAPAVDMPDEAGASESALGDRMSGASGRINKSLDALSDAQLWVLAKSEFRSNFKNVDDPRAQNLRLAVRAAMESFRRTGDAPVGPNAKAFYDAEIKRGLKPTQGKSEKWNVRRFLADYFQTKFPVEGGEGKLPPHEERLARIVKKLLDPQTVERAKTGIKASTDVSTNSPGTIVNEPKAGAFVGDVERTFRAWVDKHLGRAGYSGSSKEFAVEVATALARQMPNLDFFRIVGSEYGLAGTGESTGQTVSPRGKLGLNMDRVVPKGEEYRALQQVLQTLAHEMTHMDGFIRDGLVPRPDAYSDERTRLINNLDHLAKNLNDDERLSILTVLNESVPEQFRSKTRQADGRLYGTSNPDEFVAEVVSKTIMMLANDTAAGRAAAKEALDYGPAEVREIARDGFRTVRDTMLAMREALTKGEYMTGATDPVILGGAFDALLGTAEVMTDFKQADIALALGRQAIANIAEGGGSRPPARMTDAVWFRGQNALVKAMKDAPVPTQTAIDAINEVQDKVFSPRAYDEKNRLSSFASWFYPFANRMSALEKQGIALGRDVMETVFDYEPGISRLYSFFLGDFLKKQPNGSVKFDETHPLVQLISDGKNGPWREGFNAVSAWQSENGSKPMFVKDEKGVIVVNPDPKLKAQAAWDRISHRIPKDQLANVMGLSVAFDAANARAASTLVYQMQQSNVAVIATYLMTANKRMGYDQALQIAQKVHDVYLNAQVPSLNGTLPPAQLAALGRLLVGNPTPEKPLGDGLLASFVTNKHMLESRTGHRYESLPHDWIIKYEENGKVRFDSRPTETQAKYLANRITARGGRIHGEILNRKQLRTPAEFDHPDSLLAKVAETENFVWENFVATMEQENGAEFADSLRMGYAPVAQSLKDFQTSSMSKMLRQRKDLVDRENYDYVDGQFVALQRAAVSMATRSMQQQMRLIVNDPRARFLESFRKDVTEHVSEMLSPQTEWSRKAKAFVTTNFLGLNLASTAINLTQSGTTLVPLLIAGIDPRHQTKGGPVKAWKDLGLAVGDATRFGTGNSWEKIAQTAKAKDPRVHTLEESLATAYRTHVENGGIAQTVIDDLVYGQDSRTLTLAKFGHGDYGPTPVSKMATDGLYLVSQGMMWLYRVAERFNARTAFLAGARQAFELGLRGDELYQYSAKMQSLATFGGGRANAPGLVPKLSTQYTRSAVGLVNSLQQYGYGMVATYGQLMKDSIGKSKGLNALQVRQAQKAFGTMLMTQVAVAGALGLPFVGAALTLLEKIFGIPATQAVREGLASLSDDDETGAVIAETGLNGFANQALGLDVSSRLGTSNLLGTSSYRGFDLRDMVGPAGSIIGNAAEALNLFGQQKPMEAAHKLVPAAFKNIVELSNTKAKYGDFGLRDSGGGLLYTPTDSQRLGYALGFRPRELSQKRAMQSMLLRADERTSARRDRELDGAAQSLLMGDPSQAQRLATDARVADPTIDTRDILRQVMDRGVAAQTPRDLLATGSRWNEAERRGIASTFGEGVNTRQSEVDAQNLRLQLAGVLGDPRLAPTADSYKRAVVIDHLVKTRGMTRSEATRLAEFLGL